MTGNVTLTSSVPVSQDTSIDLNDFTIEGRLSSALFNVNGAKLTLHGEGTVKNENLIADVTNNGSITINSGTYITNGDGFKANDGGKIVFNDGYIICVSRALNAAGNAVVEINGGIIEVSDGIGIGTSKTTGLGGNTITMNSGLIDASVTSNGYEAVGVYIANNDSFEMLDGEIIAEGGTGICMRAGEVTIHGGKITAMDVTKTGTHVPDGKIGDDDTVMNGCSAVIYHESAKYPENAGMSLTIDGGVITGVDHAIEVLSTEETPQVFVTGGTFTPDYPESVEP